MIAGVFGRTPHLPSTCVSTLEPFREQIRDWHDAGVQGTTIHHALKRNHGYTGSYSAVRRMLLGLRAERGVPPRSLSLRQANNRKLAIRQRIFWLAIAATEA